MCSSVFSLLRFMSTNGQMNLELNWKLKNYVVVLVDRFLSHPFYNSCWEHTVHSIHSVHCPAAILALDPSLSFPLTPPISCGGPLQHPGAPFPSTVRAFPASEVHSSSDPSSYISVLHPPTPHPPTSTSSPHLKQTLQDSGSSARQVCSGTTPGFMHSSDSAAHTHTLKTHSCSCSFKGFH